MGTFGFFQHPDNYRDQSSKNQKSHFLANARTERPTKKSNLANQ